MAFERRNGAGVDSGSSQNVQCALTFQYSFHRFLLTMSITLCSKQVESAELHVTEHRRNYEATFACLAQRLLTSVVVAS